MTHPLTFCSVCLEQKEEKDHGSKLSKRFLKSKSTSGPIEGPPWSVLGWGVGRVKMWLIEAALRRHGGPRGLTAAG